MSPEAEKALISCLRPWKAIGWMWIIVMSILCMYGIIMLVVTLTDLGRAMQ